MPNGWKKNAKYFEPLTLTHDDYVRNVLEIKNKFYMCNSWGTIQKKGDYHPKHTHPNSVISGVFFYGYGEEGTPAIQFHKDEYQGTGQSIMLKQKPPENDKELSPFAWKTFTVPFKPGLLLLFPSYFRHSVPPNKTGYTRKSVSMNIVPKGEIGDPHSLTQLLFNKVL